MPILWGIVSGIAAVAAEGTLAALLPLNLIVGLVVGMVLYLRGNQRAGLALLGTWALASDMVYSPQLPQATISLLLSWFVWRAAVEQRLALGRWSTRLVNAASWLVMYFVAHWVLGWLGYLVGDTLWHPTNAGTLSLLRSLVVHLGLLVPLLYLATRFTVTSQRPNQYAQR